MASTNEYVGRFIYGSEGRTQLQFQGPDHQVAGYADGFVGMYKIASSLTSYAQGGKVWSTQTDDDGGTSHFTINIDGTQGTIVNNKSGNDYYHVMSIFNEVPTSTSILDINTLPSNIAYGGLFEYWDNQFFESYSFLVGVAGIIAGDLPKYIDRVVYSGNYASVYFKSTVPYKDRLSVWKMKSNSTGNLYSMSGIVNNQIYFRVPVGGYRFVNITDDFVSVDRSNIAGNISGRVKSTAQDANTINEFISNNQLQRGDIIPCVLNLYSNDRSISNITVNKSYSNSEVLVEWNEDGFGGPYTIELLNNGVSYYNATAPTSSTTTNNKYSVILPKSLFLKSGNITIKVTAPSVNTINSNKFSLKGYRYRGNTTGLMYAQSTTTVYQKNSRTISTVVSPVEFTSPNIEVSSTEFIDKKDITFSSDFNYIDTKLTYTVSSGDYSKTYTDETASSLITRKITYTFPAPGTYTISAYLEYNGLKSSTFSTTTVLERLPNPTGSYTRTSYNSMDVSVDGFKYPNTSIKIYLDGIVKDRVYSKSTVSLSNISVGNHTLKFEEVYNDNSAFNSAIVSVYISEFTKLKTPTLSLYNTNTETEVIYNVNGNYDSTLTRKTNRIYQFTTVQYGIEYQLHIIQDGIDKVLVPFSKMTKLNAQYLVEIPENEIEDGEYQLYILSKPITGSSDYDSVVSDDSSIKDKKYSIGKPVISNSVGSSLVIVSENSNNHADLSNKNRYIKAIVNGSGMINTFSIKITNSFIINLYDFLIDKKTPSDITISFYEYTSELKDSRNSEITNTIEYKLKKLEPPNVLNVNKIDKIFSWSSVSYANSYNYSINSSGTVLESGNVTINQVNYTTNLGDGLTDFYVRSVREISTENPFYINSEENIITVSDVNEFQGIDVKREKNIVTWKYPISVSGYNVFKNGIFWKKVYKPYIDLSDLSVGTYTIGIQAYRDSDVNPFITEIYYLEEFTIERLDAPVISFGSNNSILNWNTVQHGNHYEIYLNNVLFHTADSPTYTITSNEVGIYTVTMIAKSDDDFLYRDSKVSNSLTYSVIRLSSPQNIVIHEKDDTYIRTTITWDTVENASGYKYQLGNITETTTANFLEISDEDIKNQNTLKIQAISNRTDSDNPRYIDSDIVESKFGKLPTPILVLNGNIVSWKMHTNPDDETSELIDYEGADYFEIFDTNITDKDGNYIPILTTASNKYILTGTNEKTFNIYVRANSKSGTLLSSEISKPIVYTIYKVKLLNGELKFNLSFNSITNILSWPDKTQFLGADYFEVYINNELEISTVNASIDLTKYIKESGGYYKIYVIAKSYKINYVQSEKSFTFNKFINVSYQYGCRINHKFYKLITPFGLKTTASEEKDTGKIAFYSDSKEEIKAYTPISILLYTSEGNEGEPSERYEMLVASDKVTQIQMGEGCKYLHNITTIELTKLLETDFISGLTITQPLSTIQLIYGELCECQIGKNSNTYYIPEANTPTVTKILSALFSSPFDYSGFYDLDYIAYVETKPGRITLTKQLYASEYNLSLKASFEYGDTISLPYANMRAETRYTNENLFSKDEVIFRSKPFGNSKYYLIPHVDLSQEELYEANIFNYNIVWGQTYDTDNTQKYLKLTKEVVPTPGYYDLIFDIDNSEYDDIGGSIGGLMERVVNPKEGTDRTRKFRVMYRNIYIGDKKDDAKIGITMIEGIQQVIDKVSPRIIRGSNIDLAKYSFDSTGIPTNLVCPEFTFSKNKSLWEILLEMGRTFNGIPRLNENNVISFDILSQMAVDTEPIEITNEKEEIQSNMDNYASGFISDIHGMSTEHSEWYPSRDGWTTARSTNPSDPVVSKQNMGLILPHNINYIEEFWVNIGNGVKPVNIVDYVKEKTVYDALNNRKEGKGTAIYYEQGKPYIYSFGLTSANTKLAEILGLSDSNYAICNILAQKNLLGDDLISRMLSFVHSFQYRVKYKPLLDMNVITEQSNLSDMPNNVMMNFNQDANVITDTNFGKSAQIQLARIGNNDILKAYRSQNFTKRHILGECMIVDDKRYYADIVATTYYNTYVESTVSYSKDFNKINPRIGVSSEYRMWEIPNTNIVDRTIHINNYCYISKDKYNDIQQTDMSKIGNKPKIMTEVKRNYIGSSTPRKTFFYLNSLNSDFSPIDSDAYGIVLPAAYSVLGPSISYSGTCLDYLSAGIQATSSLDGLILGLSSERVQKDVFYTKDNGELPVIKLSLCNPTSDELYDSKIEGYKFETYYPQVVYKSNDEKLSDSIFDLKYRIDKDRREKLKFNYQLYFQTYDKNLNLLHKGLTSYLYYDDTNPVKEAPKWYGFNKSVRLLENILPAEGKYIGSSVSDVEYEGLDRTLTKTETKYGFKLDSINTNGEFKTVALIWPNTGEIILDYTYGEDDDKSKTPELYFNFSDTRISTKSR